ncbi:hypothetical protein ONE63_002056 [Megalurothrips usitatus]|uniref:Uncharacterized protein n=1 Tax=Megalurothrips usitatus TaxID=439358 RepID=A0AAV7XAD5_9NEOP|nr:hypothetical protein ONE63_002056 [Megalurothrips usitatus]
MPRLTRLELSMADSKSPWLADPDCLPHELCWHWDEGWPCLRRLDLRGLPAAPCEWLLAGFLRVRGPQLRELILSPGLQLTPRLVRALRRCTRLQHVGAGCGHNLWRLDAFDNLTGLTLLGLPRRSTTTWMLRSPLAARLDSLGLDGVNPSLFDVLPAVGTACHNLRTISFRRCQVPARFALPLVGCPLLQEVRADNMRAEHVMEARRLPHLERLRLSGHLGNYASMMVAVAGLRAAKPDLQVEGLEDGLFNNWGPGVQRALALSRPAVAS